MLAASIQNTDRAIGLIQEPRQKRRGPKTRIEKYGPGLADARRSTQPLSDRHQNFHRPPAFWSLDNCFILVALVEVEKIKAGDKITNQEALRRIYPSPSGSRGRALRIIESKWAPALSRAKRKLKECGEEYLPATRQAAENYIKRNT
jgi:hypothetical protein